MGWNCRLRGFMSWLAARKQQFEDFSKHLEQARSSFGDGLRDSLGK
jgi:hypothetical protein